MRLLDIEPNAIMARSAADIAQLVEQRFRKPQVTGSNPVDGFLFWIVLRLIVDDCR